MIKIPKHIASEIEDKLTEYAEQHAAEQNFQELHEINKLLQALAEASEVYYL